MINVTSPVSVQSMREGACSLHATQCALCALVPSPQVSRSPHGFSWRSSASQALGQTDTRSRRPVSLCSMAISSHNSQRSPGVLALSQSSPQSLAAVCGGARRVLAVSLAASLLGSVTAGDGGVLLSGHSSSPCRSLSLKGSPPAPTGGSQRFNKRSRGRRSALITGSLA